jgi:hypothetical protein
MKNLLVSIITLLIFNNSFAQKSESELLKNYKFYVERNIEMGKWSNRYYLENGLVTAEESYWKNELRSRTEFKYDQFNNVEREIKTFDINEGKVNHVTKIKLEYKNGLLVCKEYDYGLTEKYSDFTEHGKPKLIERTDEHKIWPHKEAFKYDENGNIIKSIVFSTYTDLKDKTVNEKATTYFKYDKWNNIIEIYREFEPKQEFPIIMVGGPAKNEFEYFRYKYKKNGLWTKKYKTVNGKEYLVAKRKYK